MLSRKPFQRGEWMLFLMPFLVLGASLVVRPLRQRLFPVATPTAVPTAVRPTRLTLWIEGGSPILPSRDGKTIITLGGIGPGRGIIDAWDAKTGRLRHSFSNSRVLGSHALALSQDGRLVAYTLDGPPNTKTCRIGIYDTSRGQRLRVISATSYAAFPCFLPRSNALCLGLGDRFEIWNGRTGKLLKRVRLKEDGTQFRAASCSPDGKVLATLRSASLTDVGYAAGGQDKIALFSTQSWRRTRTFSWPKTHLQTIGFVNNGRHLVILVTTYRKGAAGSQSIEQPSSIRLLDLKTGRDRVVRHSPPSAVWRNRCFAVAPDGRFFALTYTAKSPRARDQRADKDEEPTIIEIYDAKTGYKTASLWLPKADDLRGVGVMAFAPDNSTLYYQDRGVKRWPRHQWKIGATSEAS